MGIEHATARMREIQTMAATMRGSVPPTAPAAGSDPAAAAFAASLQSQVALGGDPTALGAAPAQTPAALLLAQLSGSSSGLGIESMLAGSQAPQGPSANVTGDVDGLDPQLRAGLEQVAAQLGRPIDIVSGNRTRSEQEVLYQRYLAGTGNLAAVPGTSRHESGQAADVYVGGVALADVPGARAAAAAAGLGFPVAGEAWHVERAS